MGLRRRKLQQTGYNSTTNSFMTCTFMAVFSAAQQLNSGIGRLIIEVSRSNTGHTLQGSSGRVISSSQRPLPDNTQHSQQRDIHALSGIRTRDTSNRAALDRTTTGISFALLTKYYSENHIKEGQMGGACGTCSRKQKCIRFGGKPEGMRSLGRLQYRQGENIKWILKNRTRKCGLD